MIHDSYNQPLSVGSIVGYARSVRGCAAYSDFYIAEVVDIISQQSFGGFPDTGKIKINLKYEMPSKTAVTLKPVIVDSLRVVLLPTGV